MTGVIEFRVTNNNGLTLAPPDGYRWRVIAAMLALPTGTTTGTRNAGLYVKSGFIAQGYAELLNTNDVTGTSTNYYSSFSAQVSTSTTPDVSNEVWGTGQGIYVDPDNPLLISYNILTGDSVDYMILVEEFV
jgi:hypothetical protein